jgi:hypothetical protein
MAEKSFCDGHFKKVEKIYVMEKKNIKMGCLFYICVDIKAVLMQSTRKFSHKASPLS